MFGIFRNDLRDGAVGVRHPSFGLEAYYHNFTALEFS